LLPSSGPDVDRVYQINGFQIELIKKSHDKYQGVRDQFFSSWKHPQPPSPTLKAIFRILNSPEVHSKFAAYEKEKGSKTVRRFHGTTQSCKFGVNLDTSPCNSTQCRVCNILRQGFCLDKPSNGSTNWGKNRYGNGFYVSSASSKSSDYASTTSNLHLNFRQVFLCKCSFGNSLDTDEDDWSKIKLFKNSNYSEISDILKKNKYDSIRAQPGNGLNYPEDVLYTSSSIIPSYLIYYTI